MPTETSIWEKMQTMDRKYIFLGLLLVILLAYAVPINFPITVTPPVKRFYDWINALKPGDVVVVSIDHVPGSLSELGGEENIVLAHLAEKKVAIIFWGLAFPDAPQIYIMQGMGDFLKSQGYVYGKDYVNFGYITGKESAAETLGRDIRSVLKADAYGTPIEKLPLMNNVRSAKDVALLITFDDGYATEMWILQWVTPQKAKVASGNMAGGLPRLLPYLSANQLVGAMGGAPGAAQYESLMKVRGRGLVIQDAINVSQIFWLAMLALGNVAFFGAVLTKRKSGGTK